MRENKTKRLMREGKTAIGTFCYFPTPWVVEIAGLAGMDFVIIDLEHAAKDMLVVESMVVAAELTSMTSIIRVPSANEKEILQVLETGAQGIMVPLVDSAETAARAVAAAKYPPDGTRGVCRSTRANQFAMQVPKFAEFAQTTNDEMLVIAMIEDKKGVDNVEEILKTGIDGVLLGPADLSGSLGVMGQTDHPAVREAIEHVTAAVMAQDRVWMGNLVFSADDVERWLAKGHRFFSYGIDTQMLAHSYQAAVESVRTRIAERRLNR
jgi:4-hydroxy-2-oxoheptanedioate aldolase